MISEVTVYFLLSRLIKLPNCSYLKHYLNDNREVFGRVCIGSLPRFGWFRPFRVFSSQSPPNSLKSLPQTSLELGGFLLLEPASDTQLQTSLLSPIEGHFAADLKPIGSNLGDDREHYDLPDGRFLGGNREKSCSASDWTIFLSPTCA